MKRSWILIIAATMLAPTARAEAGAEARTHFDRALSLADRGDYATAIVEFELAYALSRSYRILFNIAKVNLALARPVPALTALRSYLAQGGSDIAPERQTQVRHEIERARMLVGALVVSSDPPGATILVDGRTIGTVPFAAPIELAPGEHDIEARLADFAPAHRRISVAQATAHELTLALAALPPPSTQEAPIPAVTRHDANGAHRTWAWIAGSVGTAALGAGAVVWLVNDTRWRAWRDDRAQLDDAWRAAPAGDASLTAAQTASDDRLASIKAWDRATLGLMVAGGAIATAGLVLALTVPSGKTVPSLTISSQPGGGRLECITAW